MLPEFLITGFKVAPIPFIGEQLDALLPRLMTQGMNVQFFFGGTSLLIVVGVAMDALQQIESQLVMRNYDGFMNADPWTPGLTGAEPGDAWTARRGKGTQAERLAASTGYRRSRPGDMLRGRCSRNTSSAAG